MYNIISRQVGGGLAQRRGRGGRARRSLEAAGLPGGIIMLSIIINSTLCYHYYYYHYYLIVYYVAGLVAFPTGVIELKLLNSSSILAIFYPPLK